MAICPAIQMTIFFPSRPNLFEVEFLPDAHIIAKGVTQVIIVICFHPLSPSQYNCYI